MKRVLLLLVVLCSGCADVKRPNILLITLDTVRVDYLTCYGYNKKLTPNMDYLASLGMRFKRCAAPTPITLPSHVSILTGQYPVRHGVRDNSVYALSDQAFTLAEGLKGAGYKTGASVAAIPLSHRFGVDQGFDLFNEGDLIVVDGQHMDPSKKVERDGAQITEETLDFLKKNKDQGAPFFYWAHFYDPHEPYLLHKGFEYLTPYESEIAYVDQQVGRIHDYLMESGLDKNTVVVLTADHGEGLGQHGERTHLTLIYETTMAAPLIFAGPGVVKGRVDEGSLSRLVDITPTLFEMANVSVPKNLEMDGVSLAPLLASKSPSRKGPDLAYYETMGPLSFDWSWLDGVVTLEWKYIRGPTEELYFLKEDPLELNNLLEERPDVVKSLSEAANRLAAINGETGQLCQMAGRQSELFGALGYISLDARSRKPSRSAPHPKDMVHLLDILNQAQSHYLARRFNKAALLYEQCITQSPNTAMFHDYLGKAKLKMRLYDQAIASFNRALRIHPEMTDSRLALGMAQMKMKRYQEAERTFQQVLKNQPELIKAQQFLEEVQALKEKTEESE